MTLLALCAVLLLVGRTVTTLVVDHAWYTSLGAPSMFWEQFTDSLILRGVLWIAGTAFAFVNLYAVRRTILAVALPARVANLEFAAMLPSRRLLSITILLAALIGLALTVPFADWTVIALARHAVPFGEIEGILDRDLGFYVFHLPLEEMAYVWSLATLVAMIAIVTMLYGLTRSLRMEGRRIVASTHVRRHLSVLGALVLLLLAWSYRLDAFDLLQRGSGTDGLFLSIDHRVALKANRILSFACGIAALIFVRAGWLAHVRVAFVTLTLVLTAALGGRHLLPIALANSALIGEPGRRDLPYAATRTFFSRRAYDVDAIQPAGRGAITPIRLALPDIARQVSIWSPDELRRRLGADATGALDVGMPGWSMNADERAAAIAVRRPDNTDGAWSVALVDVTTAVLQVQSLGLALHTQRDDDGGVNEPIVAPGLRTSRVVRDPAGVLGTPLRSRSMRIAEAWAERDPSLLQIDSVSEGTPRLVSHRDVRNRIARLTPLFVQGGHITPVLDNEALVWAVSLYSATAYYPLSQRWIISGREQSYFRFAATALVDASTGRVRIVPAERLDPIAKVWLEKVSALVVPVSELSPALVAALPPPVDGALAQIRTFARYGSRRETAPLRHVPDSLLSGNGQVFHQVATRQGMVMAWSVPLVNDTDQLAGIMTALGGRSRSLQWDSLSGRGFAWSAQRGRLRSALDSTMTAVASGRREPKVRIGPVQIVSGANGPVLIQTLYASQPDGTPFVRQVGVLDGAHLYLGSTIAGAVSANRSDGYATDGLGGLSLSTAGERERRAAQLYDTMKEALRRGDWTRFGTAFDTLGMVLGKPPW